MRKWAVWCIEHRLRFVLYLVLVLMTPLYFIQYIPEAFNDWLRDAKAIAADREKNK